MKKAFILIITIITFEYVNAQANKIDSLKNLLQQKTPDTSRVMLLRDLGVAYRSRWQYDSAWNVVDEGLTLANRIHYKRGIAALLNSKAALLSNVGNETEALKLCLQALAINEELGDCDGLSRNLASIGLSYVRIGDNRTALSYFFKAVEAFQKGLATNTIKESNLDLSQYYSYLIDTYNRLKITDSAKFYAQKVYDEGRRNNDPTAIAYGLGYLGASYDISGENKIALEHYRSSLAFAKLSGKVQVPLLWNAMARLFDRMGEVDSAFYYGKKLMAANLQAKSPAAIANTAQFLSGLYKKQNNADSSLYYLDLAMTARDSLTARQQTTQVASTLFNEKLRQDEKAEALLKEKEERKHNLQYAAIALSAVVFFILFLLFSHSIIANQRLIKFLGILSLLIVFEFINLFIHPYLEKWTHHSIPITLGIMVGIAALLIPLHHKLEHWITHKLVEKNKKIRLAAAKKTIQQLEGQQTN